MSPIRGYLLLLPVIGLLSACGSGDYAATNSVVHDMIVATPSIAGSVQAKSGSSQALAISFNSSDGNSIINFSVTTGLSSVPTGWSGPATFACATVTTGSGCLLNLAFAPTAASAGSLHFEYAYTDSVGKAQTGSITIPYASTSNNNVTGNALPGGQIAAITGGSQSVAVSFDTDDGLPATALQVTGGLATLPAGWSSMATAFACASVSTGNGCQLYLNYAPTAVGSGTLHLNFGYVDNSGSEKTGSVAIAYASTAKDNVVGTTAPSGQINAVVGGSGRSATVTFTTDDGNPATALSLGVLQNALPAGWSSSASSLTCTSVSTGNGCQLPLTYAPTSAGSGTLLLAYGYQDNSGAAKTGTVSIPYAATAHNTVSGTAAPSGQVTAVVGAGSQSVSVAFTTDDGNAATAFSVSSALNALPAGWSAAVPSLSCASVSSGNSCVLNLTYAPTAAASGSVMLNFGYTDNAGAAKTGSVLIPYTATTHDNVVIATSPASTTSVVVGNTQNVTVTFTTDDGNAASALSVTAGLTSLPSDWSGPGSFSCASFSTGTGCRLTLTFAPTAPANGTLSLAVAYNDDSGQAKTATVSIAYVATPPPHVYVVDYSLGINLCNLNSDGTLAACAATGNLTGTTGLSFFGNFAYVSQWDQNSVQVCSVAANGSLSACAATGGNFTSPDHSSIQGLNFYVSNENLPGMITHCTIDSQSGSLTNCVRTGPNTRTRGVAAGSSMVYVAEDGIDACPIAAGGTLSTCTATQTTFGPYGLSLPGDGYIYYGGDGNGSSVGSCVVNFDGSLGACASSSVLGGVFTRSLGSYGNRLYVTGEDTNNFNFPDDVYVCSTNAGIVSGCTISDGGLTAQNLYGVVFH
jgi:hypothetical protein